MKTNFGEEVSEEMLVSFYGLEQKFNLNTNSTRNIKRSKTELALIEHLHAFKPVSPEYQRVNGLDLQNFFNKTNIGFWVSYCFFGNFDCSHSFIMYPTVKGMCLLLDANDFKNYYSSET